MASQDNVFVVLSLSGGNDGLNTVIPYTNGLYRDFRPHLGIPQDQGIPLNDTLGLNPTMAPLKEFWDAGKLAIFLGIGYPHPSYSHFRSMDIWHTCEPVKVGTEGWLGQVIKEIDPHAQNVLTGVNYGRGLPRALAKEGVPVASVGNLDTYGLLTGIEGQDQRTQALDVFSRMYGPPIGNDYALSYIRRTGTDHGAASVAFAVGEHVKGGLYGEYPSLEPSKQEEGGNLKFNMDFRSVYSTILEDWLGLAPEPIVGGNFERVRFLH